MQPKLQPWARTTGESFTPSTTPSEGKFWSFWKKKGTIIWRVVKTHCSRQSRQARFSPESACRASWTWAFDKQIPPIKCRTHGNRLDRRRSIHTWKDKTEQAWHKDQLRSKPCSRRTLTASIRHRNFQTWNIILVSKRGTVETSSRFLHRFWKQTRFRKPASWETRNKSWPNSQWRVHDPAFRRMVLEKRKSTGQDHHCQLVGTFERKANSRFLKDYTLQLKPRHSWKTLKTKNHWSTRECWLNNSHAPYARSAFTVLQRLTKKGSLNWRSCTTIWSLDNSHGRKVRASSASKDTSTAVTQSARFVNSF